MTRVRRCAGVVHLPAPSAESQREPDPRAGRSRARLSLLLLALVLLAFAPALHFHDTANERDDTCVFCHAHGSPFIASSTQDSLDPTFGGKPHAPAPGRVRNAGVKGNGSRAPPA